MLQTKQKLNRKRKNDNLAIYKTLIKKDTFWLQAVYSKHKWSKNNRLKKIIKTHHLNNQTKKIKKIKL